MISLRCLIIEEYWKVKTKLIEVSLITQLFQYLDMEVLKSWILWKKLIIWIVRHILLINIFEHCIHSNLSWLSIFLDMNFSCILISEILLEDIALKIKFYLLHELLTVMIVALISKISLRLDPKIFLSSPKSSAFILIGFYF